MTEMRKLRAASTIQRMRFDRATFPPRHESNFFLLLTPPFRRKVRVEIITRNFCANIEYCLYIDSNLIEVA